MSVERLRSGLTRIIRGQANAIELVVAALVAGGHVLIEDVPGTGKTTLARAVAALIRAGDQPLVFRRIQFTPDLLPYDVTGVDVYDPRRQVFRFVPGPIFAHVVLADEINRATPKVQSALLEVMNEGQVTVGGTTYPVADFFTVIATENPVAMEGTYPLPLAQLDRFAVRLRLGFPDRETELTVVREDPGRRLLAQLTPVITIEEILDARCRAAEVYRHPDLERAAVDLVRRTRADERLQYGASTRGALQLLDLMGALALVRGQDYVTDAELADLARPALAHRVRPRDPALDTDAVIDELAGRAVDALKASAFFAGRRA